MKIGKTLIIIIILALLAAVVTEPDQHDFEKWLVKKGRSAAEPTIKHSNGFGFSLFDVEYKYNERSKLPVPDTSSRSISRPGTKERYLGLFGTFWRIAD